MNANGTDGRWHGQYPYRGLTVGPQVPGQDVIPTTVVRNEVASGVAAFETESKDAIDQFADDFLQILTEDPEIVKTAPHNTPVKRVDEVWAARNLILRHPIDEE